MAEFKKICENCGKEYIAKNNKSKYCSSYCRGHAACVKLRKYPDKNIEKTCLNCGKLFTGHHSRKYCCKKCQDEVENRKARELHIQQRNQEFNENSIEGYDYVICPICGEKYKQITIVHFRTHGINTIEELHEKYPDIQLTCQRIIDENLVGENNPMSSKNKTELERKQSSPYSLEHYKKKGLSDDEAIIERQKFLDKLALQRKNWIQATHIEYWTIQGYTEDEAKQIIHDRSVSNGLEWHIKKYGEIDGKLKYNERILSWQRKLFQGQNRSIIADNFFTKLSKLVKSNTQYYGDNEYCIEFDGTKTYFPDYIDLSKNKIIEFYGDYWHANPIKYSVNTKIFEKTAQEIWDHDKQREDKLKELGYKVLVIWENEYRKNPEYFTQKAIKFLTEG